MRQGGLEPDFQPSTATAEALGRELPCEGARILLPGSSLSDGRLAVALRERGANVQEVVAYETAPEAVAPWAIERLATIDAVLFTSGSTARFLAEALGEGRLPERARLISIGPSTSEAVRKAFGRVDAEAGAPSLDALVAATREELAWDS
jgi:uroporphyrinogen-III synthase